MKHATPVRVVALFEVLKGGIVLLVGIGVFASINPDVNAFTKDLVGHMHLDPASHVPHGIRDAFAHPTNTRLIVMASMACVYSLVRFIEAIGLCFGFQWAKWFAVVTAFGYIPFEIRELLLRPGPLPVAFLVVNALVILVLALSLRIHRVQTQAPAPEADIE